MLFAVLVLATAVPPAALYDMPGTTAVVRRAEPRGEPVRGVVEYVASLAAFTLVNAAGAALLDGVHVTAGHGSVSFNGTEPQLAAAGACFVLSPLAAAITSWAIGKGSDDWRPSLGWASLGAYGTSLLAVGAGVGLAAANVDRGVTVPANVGLYLLVPLGTVLLQNATKEPIE